MRKNGNVLWIAPKDEIAAKEKLELEAQAAIQNLEPLRTQSFQLNYTKAADIAVADSPAGTGAARILSARGSVIAEPRTNQLFVTDIPSRLEQVQQLITKLDIAGAPGADRGAHRRGLGHLRQVAGRAAGRQRPARRHAAAIRAIRSSATTASPCGGTYDAVSGTTAKQRR